MSKSNRRKFIGRSLTGVLGLSVFSKGVYAQKTTQSEHEKLPVSEETDICILGGSCTGVFAAIRAARLGAKVSVVEKQNAFGGVATNSLVFIWHSLMNTAFDKQIISGLTQETMERLKKRNAVKVIEKSETGAFRFNSQELKIELDEMVFEHNIKPYFHTLFSEPLINEKGEVEGVIIDNKDGRSIIKAKMFIDATGDGDLCHRLGMGSYVSDTLLPPTTCAHYEKWGEIGWKLKKIIKEHGDEVDLPEGYMWGNQLPGSDTYMIAGTRVYGVNCAKAADLTKAEIEGRRQVRAMMDLARKYITEDEMVLTALPSMIGIRQSRQIKCAYQLTGKDVLLGKSFKDAIAYGSYRVDIHHHDKPGITFRYLDGREVYSRPGYPNKEGRWREKTEDNPTFYQVPLRSIIPDSNQYKNVIIAGRMLDADPVAFSGVRVMVNMNQTGEAAGVAAWLAMNQNKSIQDVKAEDIRNHMRKGGSVIF